MRTEGASLWSCCRQMCQDTSRMTLMVLNGMQVDALNMDCFGGPLLKTVHCIVKFNEPSTVTVSQSVRRHRPKSPTALRFGINPFQIIKFIESNTSLQYH